MSVAITGYGMISAVGDDAPRSWQTLIRASSGIGENTIVPRSGVMSDRAGQVRSMPEPPRPRVDRCLRLGVRALAEAIDRSGIEEAGYRRDRIGLCVGTSLGAARQGERFQRAWLERGLGHAHRRDLVEYPLHAVADSLAARFDLGGPRLVHSNACAAGAVAIVNGFELLRDGLADAVIAGGLDPLAYLSFGGFSSLGVLSTLNCAPYTRSDGITLGEGAGFLVLERCQAAERRGARVVAQILGYGLSADAYHPTAPDPRGRGALAAMTQALAMAGLDPSQVDYVNGHGTGTPANDAGEMRTIRALSPGRVPMSSTKSMIGHTLGAAGAIEAVVSVMTIEHATMHPTFVPADQPAQDSLAALEKEGRIDIVASRARPGDIGVVLSNSFAFGGNNATLALGSPAATATPCPVAPRGSVAVTGIASLAGALPSAEAIGEAVEEDRDPLTEQVVLDGGSAFPVARADPDSLRARLNPRAVRRLDRLGLLAAHAVDRLIRETGIAKTQLRDCGLILATSTGPLETIQRFQGGLVTRGEGDSKLFPNTVMNAAAGHVGMLFGMHGPTATICSGWTSGVSALHLAQQTIRNGACPRAIVVGVDEACDAVLTGYSLFPGFLAGGAARPGEDTGILIAEAGAAVLLESVAEDGAAAGVEGCEGDHRDGSTGRGPLARICGFGMAGSRAGAGRMGDPQDCLAAYRAALDQAGIGPESLAVVVSAADGLGGLDRVESRALSLLGLAGSTRILAPKRNTGETQSAAPLIGVGLAACQAAGGYALVSGVGIGGSYQSLVIHA
ncbi:beta-ketoacyl-[acyl-carrier-protein] synthase family protein [Acidipropionibacterium jensenii]|uniref:beta-ketoacyl-[acyl-carrier-protein] synthase family protein n=1 Tax=Acidipropionibacterium jensenii TaxID=1749 RepID=UPI00214B97A3|nr:beta-ketoacyl-[acyl-carrier-protein] synthase family protein [Acidipropionibacterium jensenii]